MVRLLTRTQHLEHNQNLSVGTIDTTVVLPLVSTNGTQQKWSANCCFNFGFLGRIGSLLKRSWHIDHLDFKPVTLQIFRMNLKCRQLYIMPIKSITLANTNALLHPPLRISSQDFLPGISFHSHFLVTSLSKNISKAWPWAVLIIYL